MSKHPEPDIELVSIRLRDELERIALFELDPKELHSFGYRTIAEEAALRVRGKEFLDKSSSDAPSDGTFVVSGRALLIRYDEDTEQKLRPADTGFVAAVTYMRCRRRSRADPFAPLEYVPESRHRGDHVAFALSRISAFWHQERRISEAAAFHRRACDGYEQLRQLLLTDNEQPDALTSLLNVDSSTYIEEIERALIAAGTIAECTDLHSDRKFWERLVGRRALDPRTGKPIWELDSVNRKRQAILSTRELLFNAIDDDEEIERLVPDGDGSARRARLARIREQRSRFETWLTPGPRKRPAKHCARCPLAECARGAADDLAAASYC